MFDAFIKAGLAVPREPRFQQRDERTVPHPSGPAMDVGSP